MPFPVSILEWDAALSTCDEPALVEYADHHPLGKKYFALRHHAADRSFLYADSDLLFYPQARAPLLHASENGHWFLPDMPGAAALDKKLPDHLAKVAHHTNSGLMLLQPGFRWSMGNDYISQTRGQWGYFTEQTAFHINMLENRARPLDPQLFVLSVRDQFDLENTFDPGKIAARHYVNVVRHKMWSSGMGKPLLPFRKEIPKVVSDEDSFLHPMRSQSPTRRQQGGCRGRRGDAIAWLEMRSALHSRHSRGIQAGLQAQTIPPGIVPRIHARKCGVLRRGRLRSSLSPLSPAGICVPDTSRGAVGTAAGASRPCSLSRTPDLSRLGEKNRPGRSRGPRLVTGHRLSPGDDGAG